MIGRLNHVAIAVKDLDAATAVYRDTLGAKVTEPLPQPEHGVTVVFVELPNSKVELMSPLGENSTIQGFVDKNPAGGIHHVCYEVEDIIAARDQMKAAGARVLGTGEPRIGAHGKPVIFLHPKDFLERWWSWSRSDPSDPLAAPRPFENHDAFTPSHRHRLDAVDAPDRGGARRPVGPRRREGVRAHGVRRLRALLRPVVDLPVRDPADRQRR